MKLKLIFLSFIALFTFSSCDKCKDCELKYEFINDDDAQALYELAAAFEGYNSFDEMWNADDSIQALSREYCDDDLSNVEAENEQHDIDSNQVNEIRFYYECK